MPPRHRGSACAEGEVSGKAQARKEAQPQPPARESPATTVVAGRVSRCIEQIREIAQRDLDLVGSVDQLVPELVQGPLEQVYV